MAYVIVQGDNRSTKFNIEEQEDRHNSKYDEFYSKFLQWSHIRIGVSMVVILRGDYL